MVLLRCPNCRAKGEVIDEDRLRRVRCSVCGHGFVAGEADATGEYNILSEESAPFLPELVLESNDWPMPVRWRDWVDQLAAHCGEDSTELVRRALVNYATDRKFTTPPPSD